MCEEQVLLAVLRYFPFTYYCPAGAGHKRRGIEQIWFELSAD